MPNGFLTAYTTRVGLLCTGFVRTKGGICTQRFVIKYHAYTNAKNQQHPWQSITQKIEVEAKMHECGEAPGMNTCDTYDKYVVFILLAFH